MVKKCIYQCARIVCIGRMGNHSGFLINYEQVIIFINNVKGNFFGFIFFRTGSNGNDYINNVPWLNLVRGLNIFTRSEEHTSELQSLRHLVCRLLLEKKKK